MISVLYHVLRDGKGRKAKDAGGDADDGVAFDWDAMCKELPYLGGQSEVEIKKFGVRLTGPGAGEAEKHLRPRPDV